MPLEPCWVRGAHRGDPPAHGSSARRKPSTLRRIHVSLAEVKSTQRCFCTAGRASAVELEPRQVMVGLVGLETLRVLPLELCAQIVEGTRRRGLKTSQDLRCTWQELLLLTGETWTALSWRLQFTPCQAPAISACGDGNKGGMQEFQY